MEYSTSSRLQVRGAGAVTTTGRGAVLQSSLVTRERETVTDLGMEVSMTDTLAVRETSCVGVTTARSLELTTTRRTTAARKPLLQLRNLQSLIEERSRAGVHGLAGDPAVTPVELARKPDRDSASGIARTTIFLRTRRESASILIAISSKLLSKVHNKTILF